MTSLTRLLVICLIITPFTTGQIPLVQNPSTSPNPATGRRAEYLLGGEALAPRKFPANLLRAAVEIETREDNLATAVRHHSITNSMIRSQRSIIDVEYGELRLIAFSLITAADFIALGATLAGIGAAVTFEEPIAAALETAMTGDPNITTININAVNGQTATIQNDDYNQHTGGESRRSTYSNNQQSGGQYKGYRYDTSRCTSFEGASGFIASGFYDKYQHKLNQCSRDPTILSEIAAVSLEVVALSVSGAGRILIAEASRINIARAYLILTAAKNDFILANYADIVGRELQDEYNKVRAQGYAVKKGDCHTVGLGVVCGKGPLLGPDPRRIFPDYFYGRWRASSNEEYVLDHDIGYHEHLQRQSTRFEFADGDTVSNALTVWPDTNSTEQQVERSNSTGVAHSRQGHRASSSITCSQHKTNFTIDNLHSIGMFIAWESESKPTWHWYRYNASDDSLTDTNRGHVFMRQEPQQ